MYTGAGIFNIPDKNNIREEKSFKAKRNKTKSNRKINYIALASSTLVRKIIFSK